jgi:hypothetical protein
MVLRDGPVRAKHLGMCTPRLGLACRARGMPAYLIAAEAGDHAQHW